MNAAPNLPVGPPFSGAEADTLMARLPAGVRARLAWAPHEIRSGLRPLLEHELTDDLLSSALARVAGAAALLRFQMEAQLGPSDRAAAWSAIEPLWRSQLDLLERLDERIRRPALRAHLTVIAAIWGLALIPGSPPTQFATLGDLAKATLPGEAWLALGRAEALIAALLEGVRTDVGRARWEGLAERADAEAFLFSRLLFHIPAFSGKASAAVTWYFRPQDADPKVRAIAAWNDPGVQARAPLARLLGQWRLEDSSAPDGGEWTALKGELDADREPGEKLFG